MNVIRPADGNETRVAWEVALESEQTPTSLVLTRQNYQLWMLINKQLKMV